jgi:TonB-linked SusC/RagA family outer membrane protein
MNYFQKCIIKLALSLLVIILFDVVGYSQTQVKGVVSAEDGSSLPFCNIRAKANSLNVVVTDIDGSFKINTEKNDTLIFSFVGYKTKEFAVKNIKNGTLNLELVPDSKLLDDVVVIGYGSLKRKDLTGAIGSIKAEELEKIKSLTFEEQLANKMAGVQVVASEGGPDASFKVKIRGGTSLNAGSDPLYVIDGIPISGTSENVGQGNSSTSPLSSLDPSDIASIDILKDASATAIYGSRGANGVVIITTKKGKKGKDNIVFEHFSSVSTLSKRLDILSSEEFIKYRNDYAPWRSGLSGQNLFLATSYRKVDPLTGEYIPIAIGDSGVVPVDWQDEITRAAITNHYKFGINGGTEKHNYNASFSFQDRQGIIKTTNLQRATAIFNMSQTFNKKIKTGFMMNIGFSTRAGIVSASSNNNQGRAGVITSAMLFSPVQSPRQWEGNVYDEDGLLIVNNNGDVSNPNRMLEENKNDGSNIQAYSNGFLEYKPNKNIKLKSIVSVFKRDTENRAWFSNKIGWSRATNGRAVINSNTFQSLNWTNSMDVTKNFNDNHRLISTFVHEQQLTELKSRQSTATGFPVPGVNLDNMQSAQVTLPNSTNANKTTLLSFLGRTQYDAFHKYLFTISARGDGSSKFAKGNKWGFFPSAGTAWKFSKEQFMQNVNFISNAKLRASYGITGNNSIPNFISLEQAGAQNYVFGGNIVTNGATITNINNPELSWETTIQSDIGLSLSFFKDRINFEMDYYVKNTRDLLLQVPVPSTSGYSTIWQNIGEVKNSGFEFATSALLIEKKKFQWDANFNISFNKNEVMNLGDADQFFVTAIGGQVNNDYVIQVGQSIGTIHGIEYDGVYTFNDFIDFDGLTDEEAKNKLYNDAATAEGGEGVFWYTLNEYTLKDGVIRNSLIGDSSQYRPGMSKYKDQNGDGIIDDKDRIIIGNTQPLFYGGFSSTLSYGRFDLSTQFSFSYGNDIYNKNLPKGTNTGNPWNNKLGMVRERWDPENPNNTLTSFNAGASGDFGGAAHSYYIEDGSYLRLNNISLGYKVPPKKFKKIKNIRLNATVNNLFVWTKYSGWDPDVSVGRNQLTPGLDVDAYPRARTYTLSIKINF